MWSKTQNFLFITIASSKHKIITRRKLLICSLKNFVLQIFPIPLGDDDLFSFHNETFFNVEVENVRQIVRTLVKNVNKEIFSHIIELKLHVKFLLRKGVKFC